jgi:hypothetical protein
MHLGRITADRCAMIPIQARHVLHVDLVNLVPGWHVLPRRYSGLPPQRHREAYELVPGEGWHRAMKPAAASS